MRRKNYLLLIGLILACMLLTACGCSSNDTKVVKTETTTEATTETTTEATTETTTEATTETATETTTETMTETTTEYGNIEIQSVEKITLDGNPEFPYKITVFSKATDAVNNPLKVIIESEEERGKISFSFISENESETLNSITKGRVIENNKDLYYTIGTIHYTGNIATFSVDMPISVEDSTTALYELSFKNEEGSYKGYFAFEFKK